MKKKFVNGCLNLIKKNNPNFGEVKMAELKYGLEGIYLTYTKLIIIIGLALLLGKLKECLFLLITYNVIRTFAYGLHASKSIYCLLSSLLLFIGGMFVCELLIIPFSIKVCLAVLCIICLFKYAPADTIKRPLINAKKRRKYKIISTSLGIIYLILIIYFNNLKLSNYILVGMVEATLMIHPLVYKMFNLSFDNYKNYKCKNMV